MQDFDYLSSNDVYLDSACQSLRPRPVIDALSQYYTEHNSCGERVRYAWGKKTDELVDETRDKLLKYLKLSGRRYFVSFTLNTTYGINLLLNQLRPEYFDKVMTSDIEHNSPFLATLAFAKRTGLPREVMERQSDGSINVAAYDFSRALVVVNCASNIDGRTLPNLAALVKAVHKAGGVIVVDAAQALAHSPELLYKTEADAICTSAHKMYGPSLGAMIVRRDLLDKLDTHFIGGGMVDDVELDSYQLSAKSPQHIFTQFEPGLQAWGEIIAFGAALDWLNSVPKSAKQEFKRQYTRLFEYLRDNPKIHLVNQTASPTLSCHIEGLDSHLAADALSAQGIMVRSGYFCVHYYLDHKLHLPPLIRFSLGLHTRPSDIDRSIEVLERMTR